MQSAIPEDATALSQILATEALVHWNLLIFTAPWRGGSEQLNSLRCVSLEYSSVTKLIATACLEEVSAYLVDVRRSSVALLFLRRMDPEQSLP